jgi:hypothetical protein
MWSRCLLDQQKLHTEADPLPKNSQDTPSQQCTAAQESMEYVTDQAIWPGDTGLGLGPGGNNWAGREGKHFQVNEAGQKRQEGGLSKSECEY